MGSVRINVQGTQALDRALAAKIDGYRRGAAAGLDAWAQIVRNNAVRAVQKGPKSGVVYTRGTIRHQASAPGEAPATDTGNLVRSLGWEVDGQGLVADVFAGAEYAQHLEYGTVHIKERKFLGPALEDSQERGLAIFKATLSRVS